MSAPPMIVFTDLDGTLLDHRTYSYSAANAALMQLRAARVPIVLASSKTGAEIAPLRTQIGMGHVPAIVENGAGYLMPGDEGAGDDTDYRAIRAALDALPENLRAGFEGFGDWGADGIAERTGLDAGLSALAAQRCYSEPGLWSGEPSDRARFSALLAAQGIIAQQGGRFLTLSYGATKADRMDELIKRYGATFSVALGDAPNDIAMLQKADLGIIVANPASPPLPPQPGEAARRIIRTTAPGPMGWGTQMRALLAERGIH